MRLQYLLAEFLLALVDVRVQLVTVLADGELLVVINRDVDLLPAHRFILRVVELRHIGVAQGLISSQALVRVEVEETLKQVEGVI